MSYQKTSRIKNHLKNRKAYTQAASKKKGGAPYNQNPPNRVGPAPMGYGVFEEEIEVDPAGFPDNKTLEPSVWSGNELSPEISERLMEIVEDFTDSLPFPVTIQDVRLTGSLANYNWSSYSDIDLHLVIDFSEIDENKELVKEMFDALRLRWNELHNIKIKGYDVEIYVEDVGESHSSSGIYSVKNGDWVTHPEQIDHEIDFETATKKAKDIERQFEQALDLYSKEEYEKVIRHIDRIKAKIRTMRKSGLQRDEMEYSAENIAFKLLRRNKILDGLTDLKRSAYDQSMTLDD